MPNRKVILYIAVSTDGYIAKKNGDIGFLNAVGKKGEDYGYSEFIKTVDTVIMGRKTYDKVLSFGIPFPHSNKKTYILTKNPEPQKGKILFYGGNLKILVANLKKKNGKNIFIDGGAEIVNEFIRLNLIDEIILSIIPVLLGEGIKLFNDKRSETRLELISSRSFEKGLVQIHYKCVFN
jgi:dihydrofolate reductase